VALGRLLQFAEGVTFTPGEWRGLADAVEREWTSDPSERADLAALPHVVELVQGTPEPDRPALREALAKRLAGLADAGNRSPLSAWVSDLRSGGPVRLPSGVEGDSRRVRGVLEAGAALVALGLGRDQAVLDSPPSADDLAAALTEWAGAHADRAQLWQRGDELAASIANRVWAGDSRPGVMDLAERVVPLEALPRSPTECGTSGPASAGDLAALDLPRSGLRLRVPTDWHALEGDLHSKLPAGVSVLTGPGGSADATALSNAVRLFAGAASSELREGKVSAADWARKQLGKGEWQSLLPGAGEGPVLLGGYREGEGGTVLVLYAADAAEGRLVAARGEWPVATFGPALCARFFRRLWCMKEDADLPPLPVSPNDAMRAAAELLGGPTDVDLLPEPGPDRWMAAPARWGA
jgi:hypothetical protein